MRRTDQLVAGALVLAVMFGGASLFGNKALGTLYFYACILAGLVVRVVNVRVTGGRK